MRKWAYPVDDDHPAASPHPSPARAGLAALADAFTAIVTSTHGAMAALSGAQDETEAAPAQSDGPEQVREPISRMKLLAAEDNPVTQLVIHALLNGVVGSLTIVSDGAEALEALRHGDYDLVLMDVNMPHTGGVAAVAAVRAGEAGRRDMPIVALTADAMPGDRERLFRAGFDDHLQKPIQPADLLAAVARYARVPEEQHRNAA